MTTRMQELLGLLRLVVERVRVAGERADQAEGRALRMSALLDGLADDNASLRSELDEAENAAVTARETIACLRDQVAAGERLIEALEARAAEAELRIHRAADALGVPGPLDTPDVTTEMPRPSAALH